MRGTIPSPNIWGSPDVYEIENLANDRAGRVDAAIAELAPLSGARVLDIGCGTGFHLPRFVAAGARVIGLEPHLPLVHAARSRTVSLPAAGVVAGSAEAIPLPDSSVDVAHSRWAYFFGSGSEPGLAEVDRVSAPGGIHVVVDHDPTVSTFGRWFSAAYPAYDADGTARFWRRRGYERRSLIVQWTFDSPADLEAVLAIELPPAAVELAVAEHAALDAAASLIIEVGVALYHRTY